MDVRTQQNLIEDSMIIMSGDMFKRIYDLRDDCLGWVEVTQIIKEWSRMFVDELLANGFDRKVNPEQDFIFELEKFEEKMFEQLKQYY